MKLVLVTNKNLDLAYRIQKEIFANDPDYLFLKRSVECNNIAFKHYLGYIGDKPVGITGVYVEEIDKDSIWLSWFGVLPNERRKGYGRKLLSETEKLCKTLPYKFFRCYTSTKYNAFAIPLYNSFYEISEPYENQDDETYDNSTVIYSSSLTKDKVTLWNNKYIGIKEYDNLCVQGEQFLKNIKNT